MKYYRAKNYIDNPEVYSGVIVKNELLTTDEIKKYNCIKYINEFDQVDIKPKNTYFFFGARFEMEDE